MKKIAILLIAFIAVPAAAQVRSTRPQLASTRELTKYVGTYPCNNGLLEQHVLLSALRQVLKGDYHSYREHMRLSGCGAIERLDGYLLMDVSQLHVGGYTSFILVRVSDGAVFLFWLKSQVADKDYAFYGSRPIPPTVSKIVESELNTAWGHVAQFAVAGDSVRITLRK